ncbi:MAG TPA: hypothetical protein VHA53_06755, partial [Nitrolancea sp.]|nr:hypothetical protein [Nitrolancea sp.]
NPGKARVTLLVTQIVDISSTKLADPTIAGKNRSQIEVNSSSRRGKHRELRRECHAQMSDRLRLGDRVKIQR